MYSTFVDIPPGGTVDLEVDLSGAIEGRRYVLDLPVQPFAKPDEASVHVEVAGASAVSREADGRRQRGHVERHARPGAPRLRVGASGLNPARC